MVVNESQKYITIIQNLFKNTYWRLTKDEKKWLLMNLKNT